MTDQKIAAASIVEELRLRAELEFVHLPLSTVAGNRKVGVVATGVEAVTSISAARDGAVYVDVTVSRLP